MHCLRPIATPTTTSYSDSGLLAGTSYSYRVRATDAATNLSGYSNTASATTLAPPPTASITFVPVVGGCDAADGAGISAGDLRGCASSWGT